MTAFLKRELFSLKVTEISRNMYNCYSMVWLAFVIAALYGAITISMTTWERYQENPTVISMEQDRYNWNTSFPSATICPDVKISQIKLDKYIEYEHRAYYTLFLAGNKQYFRERCLLI